MSNEIILPSGSTVVLRDPATLRHKDRQKLYVGLSTDQADLERGMALMDRLIAMVIVSWSFDLMLPSLRVDVLGELDIADYDFLSEKAQEVASVLFPQLKPTAENEADPKAITENFKD
jgi:hypothetical protein